MTSRKIGLHTSSRAQESYTHLMRVIALCDLLDVCDKIEKIRVYAYSDAIGFIGFSNDTGLQISNASPKYRVWLGKNEFVCKDLNDVRAALIAFNVCRCDT